MNSWLRCVGRALLRIRYTYIGFPGWAAIIAVLFVGRHQLWGWLSAIPKRLAEALGATSLAREIFVGALGSIFGSIALALCLVMLWRLVKSASLAGQYSAFLKDPSGNFTEPWGNVTIKWNPLEATAVGTPVHMTLICGSDADRILLEGNGRIVDRRYLVGHYVEVGNRRRLGSFTYVLDGNGDQWTGRFDAVTPDSDRPMPAEAQWRRN